MQTAAFKDPVSGFSHLVGLALALLAVPSLLFHAYARRDVAMLVTGSAYGLSLIALYSASSAYHLLVADERATRRLRLLDHTAIYLLIAGTCTPFFDRAFVGTTRLAMLSGVWALALVGIALKLAWRSAPRALYTGIYVAMGWLVVIRWSAVVERLPSSAVALLVAGGVAYTVGAVVYAAKRPDPYPKVFGFHEIWHLFVLAGSGLHFAGVVALMR
jgi:hemolysin III